MYKLTYCEVDMNSNFDMFDEFLASLKQSNDSDTVAIVESAQALFESLRFTGFNSNFKRMPGKYVQADAKSNLQIQNDPKQEEPAGKPVDDNVPSEQSPLNAGPSGKSNNFDPIKFNELYKSKAASDLWENNHGNGLGKVVDAINKTIGKEVLNPSSTSNNDTMLYRRNTPALLMSHIDNLGRITVQVDTKRDDDNENRLNMNTAAKVFVLDRTSTPERKLNTKIPLDTCKISDELARILRVFG